MTGRAAQGRIRVLYLGDSPPTGDFIERISAENNGLDLTTTSQHGEILNLLPQGFDCLVIGAKTPYVDGLRIVKAVRKVGLTSIPIIIHRSDKKKQKGAKGEENVFIDVQGDPEGAKRLTETIKQMRRRVSKKPARKEGVSASPIGR